MPCSTWPRSQSHSTSIALVLRVRLPSLSNSVTDLRSHSAIGARRSTFDWIARLGAELRGHRGDIAMIVARQPVLGRAHGLRGTFSIAHPKRGASDHELEHGLARRPARFAPALRERDDFGVTLELEQRTPVFDATPREGFHPR